jgi:hypothetical protein
VGEAAAAAAALRSFFSYFFFGPRGRGEEEERGGGGGMGRESSRAAVQASTGALPCFGLVTCHSWRQRRWLMEFNLTCFLCPVTCHTQKKMNTETWFDKTVNLNQFGRKPKLDPPKPKTLRMCVMTTTFQTKCHSHNNQKNVGLGGSQ